MPPPPTPTMITATSGRSSSNSTPHVAAPPERLAGILHAIDAPVRFADLVPPATEQQARFAFMNAPLMRKRLTIGDMLIFLGWDRDTLWQELWAKTQAI